jgi:NAD(P)-dependent dehydrogenase (short-subunit alcohol dehydrogenase family)
MSLSGEVCIITGTGGSMRRAAGPALAREGALVVGCDRNVDAAEATVAAPCAAGGTMVPLQPCQLNKPAELAHTSAKAAIIW